MRRAHTRPPPSHSTSKWNKIEHRLFCHITENWRGRPLRTFDTVVDLIGHTSTAAGLRVKAKLDTRRYATGVVVTNAEMPDLACIRMRFTGTGTMNCDPGQVDCSIPIRVLSVERIAGFRKQSRLAATESADD